MTDRRLLERSAQQALNRRVTCVQASIQACVQDWNGSQLKTGSVGPLYDCLIGHWIEEYRLMMAKR